ncbi:DNA polymerase epsilon subunit 2-like isoform 2-T2 [Anomaloglossus baeobatrachus]|uniref:DNA polymerase epsilon subunit 2-like isoform X2 n=1 Tax=Anomaloglossus baeobatrachus TaxID=238106 RepID=UPI003F50B25F
MAAENLKSKVSSAFTMRGLLLRAEASKYLSTVLRSVNEVELEDVIDSIIYGVEKQPCTFVKTILSQGHMTPLPLFVSPVYWAYDYTLRLYPLPDVIVIADKHDPFSISNTECLTINPGSFPRSVFLFKVYYPSNKAAEDR